MKILIVSNTFSSIEGGATGIAYQQAVALKKIGHDIDIFAGSFSDGGVGIQKIDGLNIQKVKINHTSHYVFRGWLAMRNFRIEREFEDFLSKHSFDVVHFHNLYYFFPFSLIKIAKRKCSKVFFTAHDVMAFSQKKFDAFVDANINLSTIENVNYKFSWWQQLKQDKKAYNPFRNFYIKTCLKYCNKVFTVSAELEKALNQNGIKNTITVHNGLIVSSWNNPSLDNIENIRNRLSLQGKKVVLFAGRISDKKGSFMLRESILKIIKKNNNVCLLVVGSKVDLDNESNNIITIKSVPRTEMVNYYYLSDLVVVPSIYLDPFPTINLEAMACSRPLISTIFGGSREIVDDQRGGILVNPLRVDQLSEAIEFIISNKKKAQEMGRYNFDKINSKYRQEDKLEELLQYYENF